MSGRHRCLFENVGEIFDADGIETKGGARASSALYVSSEVSVKKAQSWS